MCIFYQRQMGRSIRSIAEYLSRSHSTISREFKRNLHPYINSYCDRYAQECAEQRKAIPRHKQCRSNESLYDYMVEKLHIGWSPEIISKYIKRDHPYNSQYRLNTETIYQWIYKNAAEGGDLHQYLVRRHTKRRKQQPYGNLRGHIPN